MLSRLTTTKHNAPMVHRTALTHYGGWIPSSREVYQAFIDNLNKRAYDQTDPNKPLKPPVVAFQNAINSDAVMLSLMKKIFKQASSKNEVKNFGHLLKLLNEVVEAAPEFCVAPGREGEPIGVPMYVLFDLLSNTAAAYDLFRMTAFNEALKNLLNAWGAYLKSDGSNNTLTDGPKGWFGEVGLRSLEQDRGDFDATYFTPDPTAVNRGYKSWDEFFTRKFRDGVRPIEESPYPNKIVIHNACESTPYYVPSSSDSVKAHDQFWLKGQPYSLWDMFDIGPDREYYVKKFEGGKVYQAFLSPQDYHRWHSPIHGTIVKTFILPGTYYAALPDEGVEKDNGDRSYAGALIRSQAWITMHATRAIIFIEADDTDIGLVCFIGVGMAEVSTCDVTVKEQQKVKPGDELGMFHFGGSSHTLIFGPNVNIKFFASVNKHAWINSPIAIVTKKPNADN